MAALRAATRAAAAAVVLAALLLLATPALVRVGAMCTAVLAQLVCRGAGRSLRRRRPRLVLPRASSTQ